MLDFVAPSPSPVLISLTQALCPLYAQLCLDNLQVTYDDDVVAAFESLRNKPTIICPNHPSSLDGEVMFMLSGRFDEKFTFLNSQRTFWKRRAPLDSSGFKNLVAILLSAEQTIHEHLEPPNIF